MKYVLAKIQMRHIDVLLISEEMGENPDARWVQKTQQNFTKQETGQI